MGFLSRLREYAKRAREEKKRREEERRVLVRKLLKKGVSRNDAPRLARLIQEGELSWEEAVEVAKKLRKKKAKRISEELIKGGKSRKKTFAERLSTAIEKDIIGGFQAWGTPKKRKKNRLNLGRFAPL